MRKVMTSAVDVRRPSQHHSGRLIVFSSADAASDGAGYWSNEFGWVAGIASRRRCMARTNRQPKVTAMDRAPFRVAPIVVATYLTLVRHRCRDLGES